VVRGIPVTSAFRTLLDLAQTWSDERLTRAVRRAHELEDLDLGAAATYLWCRRGRKGVRRLRRVMSAFMPDRGVLRSDVERDLVALCREFGLPMPATNVNVLGYEVDALWEDERLIVEVDTYGTHSSRAAFEQDRRRDAALQRAGYRVVRATDVRLRDERVEVARTLADLLQVKV
jgi:very-short-patch-repair endonuclease